MTQPRSNDVGKQGDLLLWVAGGAVAAVGVAWLAIMKPWSGGEETVAQTQAPLVVAMAAIPAVDPAAPPPVDGAGSLDSPLHMAELAYRAGMLLEPEEYSAWTLYSRVVKDEPANATAVEGLTKVADDLVRRGETALEQGRFDDARATVERIRSVLPAHAGANALADKILPSAGAAVSTREPAPAAPVPEPAPVAVPVAAVAEVVEPGPPPQPAVDPVVEIGAAFDEALTAGRLLTPADTSAKHFIDVMLEEGPDHALTRSARERLSRELLSRASRSLEALDTEAASVWIDEAEAVGIDLSGVSNARSALTGQQIALESAKPLPASALKIASYTAPEYPDRANERRIEGWVDVEFTIRTDGSTAQVAVANASHETYFRKEAVAAVEQWTFEPRIFMNRPIEQRSYTRIRFVQ
jgi:protein TonB